VSERWRIVQGDAREVVRTLGPVDVIITDPVWPNAPPGMFPGVIDAQALLAETLACIEARRVVIVLRSDSDPRFLSAVPSRWPFFRCQILAYAMPGHIGRKLGGDEIAYSFGEPIPSRSGMRLVPGRGPIAQPKDRLHNGHPCSRALVHMRWLVKWWSLPGEVVLDPFCGSGQIGIAVVEARERTFVGIDISPDYCALAERRITEATRQASLLETAQEAP
jgi:site-specific DNA-methyltransferase (adenine-specific)